jgi:PAS domain S-box-containing protein
MKNHAADAVENGDTEQMRARLAEAEETLRAIRAGEVDAVIVQGDAGEQVYTLRNADQPYRTVVEQMHEGAAILSTSGDILYCNSRFAELVATPLEAVIGGSMNRFIGTADRATFQALLQTGSGTHRGRLIAADGRAREAYLSLTSATSDSIERRSLIVADLTELLDAQNSRDRAERENRAKDEFMAMLAHELRNPLGAIAGAIQVLDSVGKPEGLELRARSVIARQVRHLSHLVDDLVDASRVVTGKIALTRGPANLHDLVHRTVASATGAGHIDREIEVDAEAVWIDADAVRIEQIIGNLLGNAIKFTAPGGRIRITLTADGPEALLSVEDDGTGIAADLLPRIFDLFVQGEATLDRSRGGLGIGLTLVRRLAELHGGQVTASSEGPQRGSVFTVRLPRISAPEEQTVESRTGPTTSRQKVLVVEDNQDARDMYRLVLELDGHEVVEAADGIRGLELLKSAQPDIAVVDIGLPQLNGYEVARRFRAEQGGQRTVLIALTGYGSREDRERSRDAGFDHHLIKPVSPEALRELLNDAVIPALNGAGQ